METEIRNYGDGKMIVLHTKDSEVYRKLRDSVKVVKIVPYYQRQNGKEVLVGVDLYFLKKHQKWVEQQINAPALEK